MKINYLKLRGAIGIQHGLGLEEIEIDFSLFEPGFVCLCAPNGTGKTTLIENLVPHRRTFSRKGALKHCFYLEDSFRDLRWEMNGHQYRSYITINPNNDKQEAYIYCDKEPLNDGKTGSYDPIIAKLFGSEEVFLNSVFAHQKRPKFDALDKGARKQLLIELLNFNKYENIAKTAKTKRDNLAENLNKLEGTLNYIEQELGKEESIIQILQVIEQEVQNLQNGELQTQQKNQAFQEQINQLQLKNQAQENILAQIQEIEQTISKTQQNKAAAQTQYETEKRRQEETYIINLSNLEQDKTDAKLKYHAEYNRLNTELVSTEKDITRLAKITANKERIETSVQRIKQLDTDFQTKFQQYQEKLKHQEKITGLQEKVKLQRSQIEEYQTETQIAESVPCTSYKMLHEICPLLKHVHPKLRQLADLEKTLHQTQAEIQVATSESEKITVTQEQVSAIKTELDTLRAEKWEEIQQELLTAETKLEEKKIYQNNLNQQIKTLQENNQENIITLEKRIAQAKQTHQQQITSLTENYNQRRETYDNQVTEQQTKKTALGLQIDLTIKEKLIQVKTEKETLDQTLKAIQYNLQEKQQQQAARQDQLNRIQQQKQEKLELSKKTKELSGDIADWNWLIKGLSKEGIPALKLDNAAPQLSELTNQFLSNFGDWTVSIETQKFDSKGKKLLECFDIVVNTPEGQKLIDVLSGGQLVWVDESIRQAIAVFNYRQNDIQLGTRFQDETDGPLDPERAEIYLKVMRQAHQELGLYHTFIITQRESISSQIPQRIELSKEKGINLIY
jgi:exonuclease SbcC